MLPLSMSMVRIFISLKLIVDQLILPKKIDNEFHGKNNVDLQKVIYYYYYCNNNDNSKNIVVTFIFIVIVITGDGEHIYSSSK